MALAPATWCLLAALLFGAATPASKALLDGVGPLTLAGLLYVGAALGVLPFSFRGGSPARWKAPSNLRRLAGAVLFGGVVGPVALLLGLQSAPSASVALWLNLEGVATALLAWFFFREHVDRRTWLATVLVLGASLALASPDGFTFGPSALLVLVGCVAWGLDNNLTAIIDGVTPAQSTLVKGTVAGAMNLGLGALMGEPTPSLTLAVPALLLGVFSYGASIVLYIAGAQQLGATRSQVLFSTAPFIGVALSWLVLGEAVLSVQIGAAVVVAGAVALMIRSGHGHKHHHHAIQHTHLHTHEDDHHDHDHPGLPPGAWHTHEHEHEPVIHSHPHQPDLHHRHRHG